MGRCALQTKHAAKSNGMQDFNATCFLLKFGSHWASPLKKLVFSYLREVFNAMDVEFELSQQLQGHESQAWFWGSPDEFVWEKNWCERGDHWDFSKPKIDRTYLDALRVPTCVSPWSCSWNSNAMFDKIWVHQDFQMTQDVEIWKEELKREFKWFKWLGSTM